MCIHECGRNNGHKRYAFFDTLKFSEKIISINVTHYGNE